MISFKSLELNCKRLGLTEDAYAYVKQYILRVLGEERAKNEQRILEYQEDRRVLIQQMKMWRERYRHMQQQYEPAHWIDDYGGLE